MAKKKTTQKISGFSDPDQALRVLVTVLMDAAQEGGMTKARAVIIHKEIGDALMSASPETLILEIVAWVNVLQRSDADMSALVDRILASRAA